MQKTECSEIDVIHRFERERAARTLSYILGEILVQTSGQHCLLTEESWLLHRGGVHDPIEWLSAYKSCQKMS